MHLSYVRFCSPCSPFPFILFIHLFAVLTLIDKASATSRTFALGHIAMYNLTRS